MKLTPMLCLALPLALASVRSVQLPSKQTNELAARLEAIRAEAKFPALGAALVTTDKVEGIWIAGKRRAGDSEPVEVNDRWHLGSCTKPMTATLIALLVARGDLAWDTPLEHLLPECAKDMHTDFRNATLIELLTHRAGIPEESEIVPLLASGVDGSRIEHRAALTEAALTGPPAFPPGAGWKYSNMGYIVAGFIAESATGKTWEELMKELLFEPLGMTSAGFGAPGSPDVCDEPRGHRASGEVMEPGPSSDNPPALGPAGTVHASLADWAKFAQLHLRGAHKDVKVGAITLTRETFALLHKPFENGERRYACGWIITTEPWAGGDGVTLNHNGTNSMWYCEMWLGLQRGIAILMTANQFTPTGRNAPAQVQEILIDHYEKGCVQQVAAPEEGE